MAVAILLADPGHDELVLGPDVATRLAGLGVTHVALLRDTRSVGVVLEGWAFDPADIEEAARAVFPGGTEAVRTLREIGRLALSASAEGRL